MDRIDSLVWSKVKEILENPSLLIKVIKEREEKDEGRKVSLGARSRIINSMFKKFITIIILVVIVWVAYQLIIESLEEELEEKDEFTNILEELKE